MRTRIKTAVSVAVVALAAATALFNGSPGATATQGQPVIAGVENTETFGTTLCRLTTGSGACGGRNTALYAATDAEGGEAIVGQAIPGVGTQGALYGVRGMSN